MKLLDLTLPTAADNLALDEALLDAADAADADELQDEALRLWESPHPIVVVGRSSRIADEVCQPACDAAGVPILRRSSGGAAIVAGPGCLMYSVVLRYAGREHLRLLDQVHKHVLAIVRAAVEPLAADIEHMGTSDLAIAGRKFSGNSVRCKRNHLLYHGTLLHAFDITLIDRLLKSPPRQPAYRATRSHTDFVMNLGISSSDLRHALMIAFEANQPLANWPRDRTRELVASRYSRQSWNLQR